MKFCFTCNSLINTYLPVYRSEKLLLPETPTEVELWNCNLAVGECCFSHILLQAVFNVGWECG